MKRGLVFGKFHPPHRGHKLLIDRAAADCDVLTVLLMVSQRETIPGDLRFAWLREMFPDTDIRIVPDEMPQMWTPDRDDLWREFAALVHAHHPETIDVLFTSEWYGEATARWLDCTHVAIEPMRTTVPVSATQIREQPAAYLDAVAPAVRAWLVPRIVLVGAESTGKTTLARQLAAHFSTEWVAEYGRAYSEWVGQTATNEYVWRDEDFTVIADEQQRREDAAARTAAPVLICDTDAFATDIWQWRYQQTRRDLRPSQLPGRRWYLLCDDDIAFVQDGLRDGEHIRHDMTQWSADALEADNAAWTRVRGQGVERFDAALRAIAAAMETPIPLLNDDAC